MNDEFLIAGIAVDGTVYHFDKIFSYKVPHNLEIRSKSFSTLWQRKQTKAGHGFKHIQRL